MNRSTRYRKKPVVINAVQMPTSPSTRKIRFVAEWMSDNGHREPTEDEEDFNIDGVVPEFVYGNRLLAAYTASYMVIQTLEGAMYAELGDWVIRGIQGEFYPCKPKIFEATYEPEED